MADSKIVITAGLQIPESVNTIKGDLKSVSEKLTADRALKIVANIDLSKTTQRIQSQLNTISSNLNLNLNANANNLNIGVNNEDIQQRVIQTVSVIQQNLNRNPVTANINFNINNNAIQNFANELNQLHVQNVDIGQLQERLQDLGVTIEKITPTFSSARRGAQDFLSSLSIKGIDSSGNIVTYIENFNRRSVGHEFQSSTLKIEESFDKIRKAEEKVRSETDATQKVMNEFLKLQGQFDLYSKKYSGEESLGTQLTDIDAQIQAFNAAVDNNAPLEERREHLIRIDNALKLIKVDIDALNQSASRTTSNVDSIYPSINFENGSSSSTILQNAKDQLNTYFDSENIENTASRVKRAIEDTSGELQRFYVQVERGDKSVETLTYAINEQGTAYEYLGKTIREADNSTDFRSKDLGTQWDIQAEKLKQFANNVAKAGLASSDFQEDIKSLYSSLNSANPNFSGDTSTMNAFLDEFDIARAKFQALKAEMSKDEATTKFNNRIKTLTADINSFASANQFATTSTELMSNGQSFANAWTEITNKINQGAELSDTELQNLIVDFRVLKKETQALKTEMSGNNAWETLNNRINKTSAALDDYANKNKKAVQSNKIMSDGITTFKEKWTELTNRIKSGNLTTDEFKHLNEEIATFKKEADAAGLSTNSFFKSMGTQLKQIITQWISLSGAISTIRKMVTNVINIDTAMTNLKKVTDETDATYEKFLDETNAQAKNLHSTMSDLVEQTAEWSKLGYSLDEAQKLAETSMIYSKVGEVDNATSVSDLVTAMKAFNIEAKDSIEIVDRFNKLGNEFSTDAGALGEGLSVSASTLAMAGNDLSQSLALITGGTEITQNASEMGNAIRTISLRIRGKIMPPYKEIYMLG